MRLFKFCQASLELLQQVQSILVLYTTVCQCAGGEMSLALWEITRLHHQ